MIGVAGCIWREDNNKSEEGNSMTQTARAGRGDVTYENKRNAVMVKNKQ